VTTRWTRERTLRERFFAVERHIIKVSLAWTPDMLKLYVLYCNGHSDVTGHAGYGYTRGIRPRIHLTPLGFQRAHEALEALGVIRTLKKRVGEREHPVILLAPAASPFSPRLAIRNTLEGYREHDGHSSDLTRAAGDIRIPMRAIEPDRRDPDRPVIALLKGLQSLR
jgi:hypothetical protein